MKQSGAYFRMCILPELMGNWFTQPLASEGQTDESTQTAVTQSTSQASDSQLDSQPTYCYCHGPESGSMLACDNEDCHIEWLHLECL